MKLDKLYSIKKGKKPGDLRKAMREGDIRFLQIQDLRDDSETFYTTRSEDQTVCEKDDSLIVWDGAYSGLVACGLSGAIGSTLARLRPITDKALTPYVTRYLQSQIAEIRRKRTGATIPHVNGTHLRNINIPLPPLDEQKHISGVLDTVDELRTKRRESIELLDELLKSTFLKMFGDPVNNPMGWKIVELSSLIESDDKINYGVVQPGDDHAGGMPLVRVGDFVGGTLDTKNLKLIDPVIEKKYVRSRLNGKELLISCVGSIGTICKVPIEAKGFNIARAVARVPLKESVNRDFVLHCLRSEAAQRYFLKETRTVSQPTLNIGLIKSAPVIEPPEKHQHQFVAIVESIEKQKATLLEHLAGLDTLFASLQSRAFQGEL